MTNLRKRLFRLGGALLLAAAPFGCGSEPPPTRQAVAAPPPPPTAPAKPRATAVAELMTQLGIDERVRLPEDKAPSTTEARMAILEFFDAFARGDDTALDTMLSGLDRAELEELVESGAWEETTSHITRIDVQSGQSPTGQACALAIFYVADDFQPQLWYYETHEDSATFDAVAAPPNIMERLSGTDWIAAWFDLLAEELALADMPDEEFAAPQKNYGDNTRSDSFSIGPGGDQPTRRLPGSPGKRPRPKGPKRRPPGPPG